MKASEFLKMMQTYSQSVSETGYRDDQLERGLVTLRECGQEETFIVLAKSGKYRLMDARTLQVLENHDLNENWKDLEEKELERFSPFQVCEGGLLEKTAADETSYAQLLEAAKTRIQEKEAEAAKNFAGSDVPVRPAFTGVRHGKHETFRFYTKNGMQVSIYRGGEFEQYLNARRFYEKKQLPRLARLQERKGLIFTVTASNDFLRKNGEKQRAAALMAVIREIENYFDGAVKCSTYEPYPEEIWL